MRIGDKIPDLVVQRPDGSDVALRDFLGKPLVLVFLRHLG